MILTLRKQKIIIHWTKKLKKVKVKVKEKAEFIK